MIEPSDAEQANWPDATRDYVHALELRFENCERLAERLMIMAARRSTETSFGWTHPDCETLQAAASTLRGAPRHQPELRPVGVLSAQTENRIAELEARLAEIAHAYDVTFKRRTELELALLPFAEFAEHVDENGWTSEIHREPISTWFGPSDFRAAGKVKA